MSQKLTVENYLVQLPAGTTIKEAWNQFSIDHPEITKANFDFYRNQATKNGLWQPGVDIPVTPINLSRVQAEDIPFAEELIDLNNIDMSRFTAISTGTAFDKIASKRNGIMPGTTYILTGESGAGKTTIATNLADYLKETNPGFTAGFISCEMDKDDWTEECIDNPRLAQLNTVFMLNYLEAPNYLEILTEGLMKYNCVILDSFEVVIDQLKEIKGWTAKKAESELINLLRKAASESGAIIIAIQQYTKGGTFVGSNKIKHMLTGMMFVRFDKNGERYVTFTKNRRGGHMVGKHLYFIKNKETGRLEFDDTRFENDKAILDFTEDEIELINQENEFFNNDIIEKAKEKQIKRMELLENL